MFSYLIWVNFISHKQFQKFSTDGFRAKSIKEYAIYMIINNNTHCSSNTVKTME